MSQVGYSSPAESGIMGDSGLSMAAYSVFGSMMTIGGMVGAILRGKIADIFGRKNANWLSEVFCTIGWLAIAFAKDALRLDSGRLSLGFGVGIISYVIPVYVAEVTPKDLRGVLTAFHQVLFHVYCNLQVITAKILQVKIGKEEFEMALQHLRGKNTNISQEAAEIRDHMEIYQQHSQARLLDLFHKRYANSLIIGVGLMLLQQFGGCSALAYYAGSIFEEADVPSSIGSRGMAIIQIPAAITGVLLMDIAGRRPLLMISGSGMAFGCFLIGLSFFFKEAKNMNEATTILVLVGFWGSAAFNTIGLAGIPFLIMTEIFPINVKASAGSLVILVCWSCSWIVTYTFNFMMQWSSAGTFFIFLGIGFSTVLFVAKMVPETKGRTLEEIQDSISTSFLP